MADNTDSLLQQPPLAIIQTDRLRLRTLQMSDLDHVMPMVTDPEVMKWTSHRPLETREQAQKWLSDRALGADVYNFIIELRHQTASAESTTIVGIMGCFHPPECGYMIYPEHFGKGYATEAVKGFIPAYFERFRVDKVRGKGFDYLEACTDIENWGSMRVLEKCGFERVGQVDKDFESPMLGVRSTAFYRLPGPSRSLEELGLVMVKASGQMEEEEQPPQPPIQ
ncbi:acyl-CoA N-acyltransferase [Polychaeton citri CBS 116435]|uniref:Acyl-CoA N-acyltransferase n=1 Tax=Polychaeton citri CBS 116435 TaxID=1314669 RepID=A0A9P4QA20_9PEZI|nr:acyl-CoA N-acyltransferase [Polychaeton citri CBS 116435]